MQDEDRQNNAASVSEAVERLKVKIPDFTVTLRPTAELVPYENNPRFNDGAVDQLANSLRRFGFRWPILINTKTRVVVCGHTRLKAAQKLGMEAVPTVSADDMTQKEIDAFRLVDNKVAELAVWDDIALDEEIDKLPDFDFKDFGFNYGADLSSELEDSLDDSNLPDAAELTELGKVVFRFSKEQTDAIHGYIKANGDKVFKDFILATVGIEDATEIGTKQGRKGVTGKGHGEKPKAENGE